MMTMTKTTTTKRPRKCVFVTTTITTNKWTMTLLVLLLFYSIRNNNESNNFYVFGFQSLPLVSTINSRQTTFSSSSSSSSSLWMAPSKKGNKKKKTPKISSGGGFGGSTSSSTTAADKNTNNNPAQVRIVSGHTGSGTKPLRNAANTFDALRKEFGIEACNDVYVRAPLNDETTFWFVGKIARRLSKQNDNDDDDESDDTNEEFCQPTPEMAIWSQKRLILEYAKHQLRPQNLGGKYSKNLELWLAPGDSEMECVQNKISLTKVNGSANQLPASFRVKDVGYNPEIYVGDEQTTGGLRIARDPETGEPINPVFEVNESV